MRSLWAVGILAFLALSRTAWGQAKPPAPRQGPTRAPSAARLANADELRARLRLNSEYDDVVGVDSIKIAILDYGFQGIGGEVAISYRVLRYRTVIAGTRRNVQRHVTG